MSTFWCEHAWLDGAPSPRARLHVHAGRFTAVERDVPAQPGDERLAGLVLPGFANAHSHAFHRALRGRTHDRGGSFWSWRERMYALAAQLDPDTYLTLARATYAEMALAGVTAVGEFHYLHHGAGGRPYADPNAMSEALVAAAADAGLRLTLLDTCYLAGGLDADGHTDLDPVQQRFSDGGADAWAERVAALPRRAGLQVGAAVHSVRAVPLEALEHIATARPALLHVHLSEQPAENDACLARYGRTPTALLADTGLLGPTTTAVHATHLTAHDIELLGASGTGVCACPSTEADLGDGLGPFGPLLAAGSPLSIGSDQHATVDLLAEARLVDSTERLRTGNRASLPPGALVEALTAAGQRALAWPDAGRLDVGGRADLVAVSLDSVRTAGSDPAQVVHAAAAPDVRTVVVDGRVVVRDGVHRLGDVGRLLQQAIGPLWR